MEPLIQGLSFCHSVVAMYLLKARERLQDVEREEAREQRRHELGIEELYIVQGAIYTEGMPEDGPKGAKMKCKVYL